MTRASFVAVALSGLSLCACGGAREKPSSFGETNLGDGALGAHSGTALERFFPLVHGHLWSYVTTSDEGDRGLLLVRARRTSPTEGALVTSTSARRIRYESEGVGLADRYVYVLKAPLAVGTMFMGEHGGKTRVDAVGVAVDVPAGHFEGCVVTVEERLGDAPVRYSTTFCPDVGIVVLDVEATGAHERAELQSYGPPVSIGPEGSSVSGP